MEMLITMAVIFYLSVGVGVTLHVVSKYEVRNIFFIVLFVLLYPLGYGIFYLEGDE
jgi:hypothetical protein